VGVRMFFCTVAVIYLININEPVSALLSARRFAVLCSWRADHVNYSCEQLCNPALMKLVA